MSKQNVQYESVTKGAGIMSTEIILDHSVMTDSSTTGTYEFSSAIPPYSLRLGCVIDTLETYSAAITVAVGISAADNTWTSATTGVATTVGYKAAFPYGASTIITGAFSGSTAESVHVTITDTGTSDWTLITSGKIKLKVFYIATQVS